MLGFDTCLLHFILIKSQENSYQKNRGLINYAKLFFFFCIVAYFCLKLGAVQKKLTFYLVAERQEGRSGCLHGSHSKQKKMKQYGFYETLVYFQAFEVCQQNNVLLESLARRKDDLFCPH